MGCISNLLPIFSKNLVRFNTITMNENILSWDASYEIILALMDAYPNIDVESVGTAQLQQMIVGLPNFVDDPALMYDGLLDDILRDWYEETFS